jgi:hypothetical protein
MVYLRAHEEDYSFSSSERPFDSGAKSLPRLRECNEFTVELRLFKIRFCSGGIKMRRTIMNGFSFMVKAASEFAIAVATEYDPQIILTFFFIHPSELYKDGSLTIIGCFIE